MIDAFILPTLYHKSKSGKISEWMIVAKKINGIPYVYTRYGYIDGTKQETQVRVDKGKNIGKSNETTAWEQACLIAKSKWEKQKLGNYREDLNEETMLLPMLAHRYQDHKHRVHYPCYAQPKLNGCRVLAKITEDGVEYWSRKGKEYETFHHWDEELKAIFPVGTILDGEAYNPNLGFQEIVRRVKRVKTSRGDIESDPLQYWVYDVVQENMSFLQRNDWILEHVSKYLLNIKQDLKYLHLCTTLFVENEYELNNVHKWNVRDGFEGTIIRSKNGLYKPDYRSYDLLKYKDFIDEEFKIVGGESAQGRDEGTVIFVCELKPDTTFNVRPKGSFAQRKEWLDDIDQCIGKMLTVRYQEKSEDGVPIFPVGLGIRDYE